MEAAECLLHIRTHHCSPPFIALRPVLISPFVGVTAVSLDGGPSQLLPISRLTFPSAPPSSSNVAFTPAPRSFPPPGPPSSLPLARPAASSSSLSSFVPNPPAPSAGVSTAEKWVAPQPLMSPPPLPSASFRTVRRSPEREVISADDVMEEDRRRPAGRGRSREVDDSKAFPTPFKRQREDTDTSHWGQWGHGSRADGGVDRGNGSRRPYDEEKEGQRASPFMTGVEKLAVDNEKKGGGGAHRTAMTGARPSGLAGQKKKFNAPRPLGAEADGPIPPMVSAALQGGSGGGGHGESDPVIKAKLDRLDAKLVDLILREVVDSQAVVWEDIAGLDYVKSTVREIVVWPMKFPHMFTGLRAPPKGMLLFGPRHSQHAHAHNTHTATTSVADDEGSGRCFLSTHRHGCVAVR